MPAVAAPGPAGLVCPGSTDAAGQAADAPVGYMVEVALTAGAEAGTRRIRVTRSCGFRYRGRVRSFAEGGFWELRRVGGRWRISAALDRWIT